MPINGLSVGRDNTIDIYDPNVKAVVSFAVIKSFSAKPITTKLDSKGMDGRNYFGSEPNGWDLKMTLDRASNVADLFFAALEEAYFSGQNIQSQTITQNILEADGSYTEFRYTGVDIVLDDAGDWQNGKYIGQSLSARADRRHLVSSGSAAA